MYLGMKLIVIDPQNLSGVNSAAALVAFALMIGYFKGKYVMRKSANRIVARIQGLPNPISLFKAYHPAYFILIASMMGIGMFIKALGLPNEIRGFIDVAIGSALINGSMNYFRSAKYLTA